MSIVHMGIVPSTDKSLQAILSPEMRFKIPRLPKLHVKPRVGAPIPIRRPVLEQSQQPRPKRKNRPLSPLPVPALMKAYLAAYSKVEREIPHRSRPVIPKPATRLDRRRVMPKVTRTESRPKSSVLDKTKSPDRQLATPHSFRAKKRPALSPVRPEPGHNVSPDPNALRSTPRAIPYLGSRPEVSLKSCPAAPPTSPVSPEHPVVDTSLSRVSVPKKSFSTVNPLPHRELPPIPCPIVDPNPPLSPVPYAVPCPPLIRAPSSIMRPRKRVIKRVKTSAKKLKKTISRVTSSDETSKTVVNETPKVTVDAYFNKITRPRSRLSYSRPKTHAELSNVSLVDRSDNKHHHTMTYNFLTGRTVSSKTSISSTSDVVVANKECQTEPQKKKQYKNVSTFVGRPKHERTKLLKTAYRDRISVKPLPNGLSTSSYVNQLMKNGETKRVNQDLVVKIMKAKSTLPSHLCRR